MNSSPKVVSICGELAGILDRSDPYFAGLARELATIASKDILQAAPVYQSLDWWGGSGSFADMAGVGKPEPVQRRINELMIQLFEEFEWHGIQYERAFGWMTAFRMFLDADAKKKAS